MEKGKFNYATAHLLLHWLVQFVVEKRRLGRMLCALFLINSLANAQLNMPNNAQYRLEKKQVIIDTMKLPKDGRIGINYYDSTQKKVKMGSRIMTKWIPFFKGNKSLTTNDYLSNKDVNNKSNSIKMNGSLSYSTDYYASSDTPYSGKGVYQYTAQTRLGLVYKNLYPIGIAITNRFSNSGNFPNLLAINIQFEQQKFIQTLKERLKQQVQDKMDTMTSYNTLPQLIGEEKMELERLTAWLHSPAVQQKIVEMKEAALEEKTRNTIARKAQKKLNTARFDSSHLTVTNGSSSFTTNTLSRLKGYNDSSLSPSLTFKKVLSDSMFIKTVGARKRKRDSLSTRITNTTDNLQRIGGSKEIKMNPSGADLVKGKYGEKALSKDSLQISQQQISSFTEAYQSKLLRIDSLRKSIAKMEKLYAKNKQLQNKYSSVEKLAIDRMNSTHQLKQKMQQLGISDTVMPKGYRHLFALSAFGIGRNMVSFSALTARNTSVTGIQVEYNPSYYLAFASGVVDYQLTDFWVGKKSLNKQQLHITRAGYGLKAGNHFYISCFWGQRQIFRPSLPSNSDFANSKLFGYAFEGQCQIGKHSLLSAEFAKSSFQNMPTASAKSGMVANSFNYELRSNEAFAVQFSTLATATQTKVVASYKLTGSDFQSFSVFSTGVKQSVWCMNADQPLFHNQLMIHTSLQTNDATNPNTTNALKNISLLASLQATLRIKRWPIMNMGYFPSSQTSYLGGKQFSANQFYTLFANITHHYKVKRQLMNTTLLFNRFYNRSDDSGFLYSDARNIQLNQAVFFGKLTCQGLFSATKSSSNFYYTVENTLQYQWKHWLMLGGGIKYNRQANNQQNLWGYSASTTATIPKIGQVQLIADRGFLPNSQDQLIPFDTGRLSFLKSF